MEAKTIFPDKSDIRRSKLFWFFLTAYLILIVLQGVKGLSVPELKTFSIVTLTVAALMLFVLILAVTVLASPHRRPRITIDDKGVEIMPSPFRKTCAAEWEEISSIDLQPNAVVISLKDAERRQIKLVMPSYVVNQEVKASLEKHALVSQPS